MRLLVRSITLEAEGILSFELVHPDRATLPPFEPGSHVDVTTADGRLRQYSLCNDPAERQRYRIAVLREVAGRGGSRFMHEDVRVGEFLEVSLPRNHFPLAADAGRHLLIAGGVGITPILSMAHALRRQAAAYEIHYCTRSAGRTAFKEEVGQVAAGKVSIHHDHGDPSSGLDVAGLLRVVVPGTHVYCCGPAGLMRAVEAATTHWPPQSIHFEHFAAAKADPSTAEGDAEFEVELTSTGAILPVPADRTILAVLRNAGTQVESSCEAGVCGTCRTRYLSGSPHHRDYVLTDDERRDWIMVCVSRATPGDRLVLDL